MISFWKKDCAGDLAEISALDSLIKVLEEVIVSYMSGEGFHTSQFEWLSDKLISFRRRRAKLRNRLGMFNDERIEGIIQK